MQIALEVGMADLDLERAIAERVGTLEKLGEFRVAQMEVETRGIGADPVAPAAEQPMKRQADLFRCKIPESNLHGLVERQAVGTLVTAARAVDAMHQRMRVLAFQAGPDLAGEDPDDLVQRRESAEKALCET